MLELGRSCFQIRLIQLKFLDLLIKPLALLLLKLKLVAEIFVGLPSLVIVCFRLVIFENLRLEVLQLFI